MNAVHILIYYYLKMLLELAPSIELSGVDKLYRGTLIKIGGRHVNLYVGTSGYSYKEWKGTFYPGYLAGSRCSTITASSFVRSKSTIRSIACLLRRPWKRGAYCEPLKVYKEDG